jgi:hypothetical protein
MECFQKYKTGSVRLYDAKKETYECPKIKCGFDSVVDVDENIISTVIELNKRGYKTMYSCSGHLHDGVFIMPNIMFDVTDRKEQNNKQI